MEIFDLYDKDFNLLPHTMERGSRTNKGEYHLVVHVWIKNNQGMYLMQQRNKPTDRFPYQWASCGGAVTTGEESLITAQREVEEEMGILIPIEKFNLKNHYFVSTEYGNYIIALYLVEEEINIKDLTFDYKEVKRCKYFSLDEIKKLIKRHQCWDYEETKYTKGYYTHL